MRHRRLLSRYVWPSYCEEHFASLQIRQEAPAAVKYSAAYPYEIARVLVHEAHRVLIRDKQPEECARKWIEAMLSTES
jgi:hypothetical protein